MEFTEGDGQSQESSPDTILSMDSTHVGQVFTELGNGVRDTVFFAYDPAQARIIQAGPDQRYLDPMDTSQISGLVTGMVNKYLVTFDLGLLYANKDAANYVAAAKSLRDDQGISGDKKLVFMFPVTTTYESTGKGSESTQVAHHVPESFKERFGAKIPQKLGQLADA